MDELIEDVICGEIAERRLAQVSERWAAVPAVGSQAQGEVQ